MENTVRPGDDNESERRHVDKPSPAANSPGKRGASRVKLTSAPEGFELDKYARCATLPAAEWGRQIAKRFFLEKALALDHTADLARRFRELITEPLAEYAYASIPQATSQGVVRPHYVRSSIRPLRLHDLYLLIGQLWDCDVIDGDELIDECAQKYEQLESLAAFGRIQVDLHASDEDLIAAFSLWLKLYRRSLKRPSIKRHKSSDLQLELDDWHRNRMLPYKDLTLWCKWKGLHVTNERLVALLFSHDDSQSPSRLRSTKRDVEKYLTLENIHALLLSE